MRRQVIFWLDLLIREQHENAPEHLRFGVPRFGGGLAGGLLPPEGLGILPPVIPRLQLSQPGLLGQRPSPVGLRSEEHTSELQSLMRISYAVFCLEKKTAHN